MEHKDWCEAAFYPAGTCRCGADPGAAYTPKMACCDSPVINDFSQRSYEIRHLYCSRCKSHLYRDMQYTAKEWDEWINN